MAKARARRQGRREAGSATGLIMGILFVLMGAAAFVIQHNKTTRYQLAQAMGKMEIDAIAMSVHRGIRAAMLNYPESGCLPAPLSAGALGRFRRFDNPAPVVEFELSEDQLKTPMACLLSDEQRERTQRLKVKLLELSSDGIGLMRRVEAVVEVTSKATSERISRTVKIARSYDVRPLSLARFGLTFNSDLATDPFVTLDGTQTKLQVFSNVLFAGTRSPAWNQLLSTQAERLTFNRNSFARFSTVQVSEAVNVESFRQVFRYGLQTGALRESFVPNFLPQGSGPVWKQRFDYQPQYYERSYPVPEITGTATKAYCGSSDGQFSSSRAGINSIPDAAPGGSMGSELVSKTCQTGSNRMAFLFMQPDQDLTINLKPGDSNFCGIVLAKTLKIVVDSADPYIYGMLGNFYVERLVIENKQALSSGFSEVRFYNPGDGNAPDGLQPVGQSMGSLSSQLNELGSSTAWNFFVPFASMASFTPRTSSQYLAECPEGGVWSYRSRYEPMSANPSQFSAYQMDQVGALYSMENF